MAPALAALARPVALLAVGGTISMRGERAVPAMDARQLVQALPELGAVPALRAETLLSKPGPQLTLPEILRVASDAARVAAGGEGVVITTGTDTLEELAVLCALLAGGPAELESLGGVAGEGGRAPIVVTGANRPASHPGADGGANLLDAVTVAGSQATEGMGVLVVFGGEIHSAMTARKVDSTGPAAFGSPLTGPVGRVLEGRVWIAARPLVPGKLGVAELSHRVDIVTAAVGDDGTALSALADGADGLVVVAFGAGHLSVPMLARLREATGRLPVVITCRPERPSMLAATYGFEGSEADLRASGAICAPFLSPVAARMVVLACLGAGLDKAEMAAVLAPWDAR